jgi:Tfp pilus assembly protein PilX
MKKYFKERNGEKGIALLFTLGMLTVLLVLAMGFATTSITQRKNAANNVYGTTARLLAESTLERIMGTLQNHDVSQFTYSHCDAYTHPKISPSDPENWGTSDWLYKIETSETGPISSYGDMNWEYITVNGKVIGRVAYVIVSAGN